MSRSTVGSLIALLAILGLVRSRTIANFDQRQEGNLNVQIDVKDVQIVALVGSDKLEDFMNYDYYDYADFTIKPSISSTSTTTSKPLSISISTTSEPLTTRPTNPPIAPFNSGSSSSSEPSSTTAASNINSSDSSSIISIESSSSSSSKPIDSTESSSPDKSISSSIKPIEQSDIVIAIDIETSSASSDVPSTPISTAITSEGIIEGVNLANKIEGEKQQQQQQHSIEAAENAVLVAANEGRPDGIHRPPAAGEPRKRCPVGFLLKSGRCFKRRLSLISPRLAFMKLAPALLGKSGVLSGNLEAENS